MNEATYKNYLFPPFQQSTYDKLSEYPEFADLDLPDKNKFIDYLIFVYDPASDLNIIYADDLYMRKKESALRVGFKLDEEKHFDEQVENVLIGNNEIFNLAQFRFLRMFGVPILPVLIKHLEMRDKEMSIPLPDKPSDRKQVIANIDTLTQKIEADEQKFLMGRETEVAKASLYRLIERIRVPRPENIAQDTVNNTLNLPDPYNFKKQ